MMHEFTTGVSKGNIFQECGSWAPVEIDGQTVSSSSCIIELAECLLFMRKATLNVHDTSLCSGMINLLLPWAVCSSLREHHTAHAAMSLRDAKTRANLHLQGGVVRSLCRLRRAGPGSARMWATAWAATGRPGPPADGRSPEIRSLKF